MNKPNINEIPSVDRLLNYLEQRNEDRGLMANMRAGLREATQTAAWPVLAAFCDLTNIQTFKIYQTVAGLYALHPRVCADQNMGLLCRRLCDPDELRGLQNGRGPSEDIKEGPMSKRLRRLLDADRLEICDLVVRIVTLAKSRDIPVDYSTLAKDMLSWTSRTKREWAQSFWGTDSQPSKAGEG